MFSSAVTIDLAGKIDERRLQSLRTLLRLKPEGRPGDAWDEILGRRTEDAPGGRVQLLLYREDVDGPWAFHLNVQDAPAVESLNALVEEAVGAARASGLAVTGIRKRDRATGAGADDTPAMIVHARGAGSE
jgi:hypothetical protein